MKMVTAIIRPEMLGAVHEALVQKDIVRITVSRCSGHGQQGGGEELYRGQVVAPSLLPKVRLDIACNDEFVEIAIDTILDAAISTEGGAIGDGKIFVTPLEQVIRIRTRERGGKAI